MSTIDTIIAGTHNSYGWNLILALACILLDKKAIVNKAKQLISGVLLNLEDGDDNLASVFNLHLIYIAFCMV